MQASSNQHPIFCVLGGGSWGTALAILLASNNIETRLWVRDEKNAAKMQSSRRNDKYLPNSIFPEKLSVTSDMAKACSDITHALVVVPSRSFREVSTQLARVIPSVTKVALATKGLEHGTFKFLHTVAKEELGQHRPVAVISGPTFAKEVAAGLPTAVTVAAHDAEYAQELASLLHNDTFRAYTCSDVSGVEVGGAVKNVMAIAAGIADGLGLGSNTRAALITRGLVEIQRLGVALGGHKETFMGLAGLGDLVLTCTDNQSRNRRVGLALAQGKALPDILAELGQVAEGTYTAQEVVHLAKQHGVEMPISEHVYRILYLNENPRAAVHALLTRALKPENEH